jgi:hypothetical protein
VGSKDGLDGFGENNLPVSGLELRAVQPIASRSTHYAIQVLSGWLLTAKVRHFVVRGTALQAGRSRVRFPML